jgi:ABC-type lipoprotein export system ATPase subunit
MSPHSPLESAADRSALLSFERVTKAYPDGRQRIVVLREACFDIYAGDFIGILGPRRTGKTTLLRLAAGIELPDAGTVSFAGRDMASISTLDRGRLLRGEIGLLATDHWRPRRRERVVDLVALPLIGDGATMHEARRTARRMLQWADAADCADDLAEMLSVGERTRVMLARALVCEPRLLLVDEPAVIPSPSGRDEFYELLRAGAREHNAALVVASEDPTPLRGATVMMSIGDGELCSSDERGVVLSFPERRAGGTEQPGS